MEKTAGYKRKAILKFSKNLAESMRKSKRGKASSAALPGIPFGAKAPAPTMRKAMPGPPSTRGMLKRPLKPVKAPTLKEVLDAKKPPVNKTLGVARPAKRGLPGPKM